MAHIPMATTAEQQLRRRLNLNSIFGAPNVFTPQIIDRQQVGSVAYELSLGAGIYGQGVLGVTVRDGSGPTPEYPSQLFYHREEADHYINIIRTQELLKR
jgi:hypothetical protein